MNTRMLNLPPSIDHPAIELAAKEYRDLNEQLEKDGRALDELHEKHHAAREADEQAAADAIRGGTRVPAPAAQRKSLDQIAAKEQRLEALRRAIGDSRDDLIATVERHTGDLTKAAERDLAEKREAYVAAVDALSEAHAALGTSTAKLAWIQRFADDPDRAQWTPGAYLARLSEVLGQNGEPHDVGVVLAALRDLPNPPKPTIPRMPVPSPVAAGAIPGRAA